METRFENRIKLTEAMIAEASISIKWLAVLRWMLVILFGFAAPVMAVVMIGSQFVDLASAATLLLALMLSAAFVLLPQACAKLEMHRIRKKYGGAVPTSITWFGSEIATNDGEGKQYFSYSQITNVRMFSDYFAIFVDHFTLLLLSYDGFTKGTFEEFKQFLREKRPDLKIPE